MRPPSTYSTPGLQFPRMAGAGSVMILAIRSLCPSSNPPNFGNGEFSAAEVKAANLETECREKDRES